MSGFLDIVVAAFVLQLLVLPGEKGQIVIASLATKYNPYVVVAGASTAFGAWTAVEILLGNALKGALPAVYLDGITAGLFVLFAVWILYASRRADRSAEPTPEDPASAGPANAVAPGRFEGFVPSFSLMVFGEFGDKTQLVTISLAVEYGAHAGIWVGEMLVIIPISLANAYFFSTFSHRFDVRKAHVAGAALFFFFGLDTFLALLTGFSVWEEIVATVADVVGPVLQSAAGLLPLLGAFV